MRLNGWHRSWIFVSLVYMCGVAFYCVSEYPSPERIAHRYEFYKELSEKSFAMLNDNGRSTIAAEIFADDTRKVQMPNGHMMVFSNKFQKAELDVAAHEYWEIVKVKAKEAGIRLMWHAFLYWLIPCIGLYLVGRGIGWVYKGFKSK